MNKKVKTSPSRQRDRAADTPTTQQYDRRRLLKALAGTGSVLAAGGVAPESWTRPVVQSIVLPVHAQLSCGGPGYRGGVLLTATSFPTSMLDTVFPRAYAQAAPTMATANLCISCNGDGTVNVQLLVEYSDECLRPYFAGSSIPLGQYRDLPFGNECYGHVATIRVNSVNGTANGELAISTDSTWNFTGGFDIGPGNCNLNPPSNCEEGCFGP